MKWIIFIVVILLLMAPIYANKTRDREFKKEREEK
jgi:hypothetical protein